MVGLILPPFYLFFMTKPKILVCSESSKVSSGFGVYNKYLLEGLHKTGRYEVAEFASYGLIGDKEKFGIPWKYYPNAVLGNDPRLEIYNSSVENHFGRWRFDRVVLDYRPDIVIDVRDYWMSSYQAKSPLRKYFHWILMPTVDSSPQQEEWLDTYINADAIFTYSDWGADVLKQQTSNKINYIDTASPCVDTELFQPRPLEASQIKSDLGLPSDSIVIGTVMRNQKRKLFPELIKVFESIVKELEKTNPKKASNLFLYLHTSYPDAGWDFPNLIKESCVGSRIVFTYACKKCGAIISSPFSGAVKKCGSCQDRSMVIPNVSNGIDSSILSKIMSCFDIYIQYSICEGFGMPQVEAAGCGVPVVTINYSAMEDIINKLNAIQINVGAFFKELETTAIRTYPDANHAKSELLKLVNYTDGMRRKIGYDTRKKVVEHYNWTDTINKWCSYLDRCCSSLKNKWHNNITYINPITQKDIPDTGLVYHKINSIFHQKQLWNLGLKMSDYWMLKQIQMAENGFIQVQNEQKPFNLSDIIENLNKLIDNHNISEKARVYPSILQKEDYIDYANR